MCMVPAADTPLDVHSGSLPSLTMASVTMVADLLRVRNSGFHLLTWLSIQMTCELVIRCPCSSQRRLASEQRQIDRVTQRNIYGLGPRSTSHNLTHNLERMFEQISDINAFHIRRGYANNKLDDRQRRIDMLFSRDINIKRKQRDASQIVVQADGISFASPSPN